MTSSLQEDLTVPQALLEIYGALDLVVQQRPELGPLVDQYLPGASENAGWSNELFSLFAPEVPRLQDVAGSVRSGLERVLNIASGTDSSKRT